MTPGQIRLMNDSRLSDAARILGFYLSTLPDGPQEMKYAGLRVLLHNTPNQQTVGRHLSQLDVYGYAKLVSPGGKGSPVYEWVADSGAENSIAEAEDSSLPVNKQQQKAPIVVEEGVLNTPLVPPLQLKPLAPDAEELIHAEKETLGECVKPLGSYLRRRVVLDRQEPYVGRVLRALKPDCMNPQWRDATGAVIPMKRRQSIMGEALNELATADEEHGRRHSSGDWNNLRNKLMGLIQAENSPPPKYAATGTDGGNRGPPRRDKPADSQPYTPTNKHPGWRT